MHLLKEKVVINDNNDDNDVPQWHITQSMSELAQHLHVKYCQPALQLLHQYVLYLTQARYNGRE